MTYTPDWLASIPILILILIQAFIFGVLVGVKYHKVIKTPIGDIIKGIAMGRKQEQKP